MGLVGPAELLVVLLVPLAVGSATWASRDARRRTGSGAVAVVSGLGVLLTFPIGLAAYVHLRHRL